jgi:hypothetical protein
MFMTRLTRHARISTLNTNNTTTIFQFVLRPPALDNQWTNPTFQSFFSSAKLAASPNALPKCRLTRSTFSIDVDVKIDSMTKLQAEFENGATVR